MILSRVAARIAKEDRSSVSPKADVAVLDDHVKGHGFIWKAAIAVPKGSDARAKAAKRVVSVVKVAKVSARVTPDLDPVAKTCVGA